MNTIRTDIRHFLIIIISKTNIIAAIHYIGTPSWRTGALLRLWNAAVLPILILKVALSAGSSKHGKANLAPSFWNCVVANHLE